MARCYTFKVLQVIIHAILDDAPNCYCDKVHMRIKGVMKLAIIYHQESIYFFEFLNR